MAPVIQVESLQARQYLVRVIESDSETTHLVTVQASDYQRLTNGRIPEKELVRHAFEFLLERESKESILGRFDLPVIARYFPNFEEDIRRRF